LIAVLLPKLSLAVSIEDFNPVSHWTCNEASGTRFDSNTVTAYNLTDNNTVSSATGLLDNACDFESTNNEYLSKNTVTLFPLTTDQRTVSAWINMESLPGTDDLRAIVGYGKAVTNQEFTFALLNLSGTKYLDLDYYGGRKYVTWSFDTATWYHVAITYSNPLITYYVNGSSIGTQTFASMDTTDDVFYIARGIGGNFYFDGLMDEITIFDYALSSTEITTLYNSGIPLDYDSVSPTPTSTATSTFAGANEIVYAIAVVIFFLVLITSGIIWSLFRYQK